MKFIRARVEGRIKKKKNGERRNLFSAPVFPVDPPVRERPPGHLASAPRRPFLDFILACV